MLESGLWGMKISYVTIKNTITMRPAAKGLILAAGLEPELLALTCQR